jgi:hypothetical protein
MLYQIHVRQATVWCTIAEILLAASDFVEWQYGKKMALCLLWRSQIYNKQKHPDSTR